MTTLSSISQKLIYWLQDKSSPIKFEGLNSEVWAFFYAKHLNKLINNNCIFARQIIILPTPEQADSFYQDAKQHLDFCHVHQIPGIEHGPYSGVIPSESSLFARFRTLNHIAKNLLTKSETPEIYIGSFDAFMPLGPGPDFFQKHSFDIKVSDIIDPLELSQKLTDLGYSQSPTVEEPGSFSQRGEIFDIYTMSKKAFRLHYFDDMIEEIFSIDLETQKTIRDNTFEEIFIEVTPRVFSNPEFRSALRDNIPMPEPRFKEKYQQRKLVFEQLSQGMLFDTYPNFLPLFFEKPCSFFDFFDLSKTQVVFLEDWETRQSIPTLIDELKADYDLESERIDSDNLLPGPEHLFALNIYDDIEKYRPIYVSQIGIETSLDDDFSNKTTIRLEPAINFLKTHINPTLPKHEFLRETFKFLSHKFANEGQVIFTSPYKNSHDEVKHLLEVLDLSANFIKRFQFDHYKLSHGFYHQAEKTLVLTEGDLFAVKSSPTKKSKTQDLDLFAEQIATLKEGDFVIHTDHGLGIYRGLQPLELGSNSGDFLVIEYTGNDKVYVPVYKMNLIQKHADASAGFRPDSLRTQKFSKAKSRAKSSAKKLAFDLLKLQAQRQSAQAYAFSPPDEHFREFELSFKFQETDDQRSSIEDVLNSMQKPVPMDHLVCGDVGFGKTEIGMRAAYKAVLDHKQVAVLVPTTVLALQHYTSFVSRFKDFPVKIEFISRFKTPKETKEIYERVASGDVDILIGTHKLLSDKIKYHDLGLVIVDEEQRFGVGHKEKLKLLKSSVDFLTLTATPIPRTLQLAFLGLRDLSLIKTAPPKRQSIKSYLIKEDDRTLQAAINKELSRGGQVFIVHNRVQDMESYENYIRDLVPNAKIISAHGQLPERELEKRMKAFYSGKYQILISTTIIESGIDIPNANTMIIDRADTYGLSQLHQLRGRIGRSDRKAYCYFMIPNNKILSTVAEKRLKALQTYADMGSGFNIATCDLEIRGAGDILGGEQSGHVEAIGLELYMELLKEAILELRGESEIIRKDIEINTPFSAYIPNTFISDSGERLKNYKKLSNCNDLDELKDIEQELFDKFGSFPQELKNLITVLEVRCSLQKCGLKSVQVAGKQMHLRFDDKYLETVPEQRNKIVESFIQQPKKYQFTPDFKLIYTHKNEITPSELLGLSQEIAQKILPC